jgi:hypothetical protein
MVQRVKRARGRKGAWARENEMETERKGGRQAGRQGERGREGGRREKERERDLALRDVVRVLGRHGEPALLVRLCESITTTNESEKVRASE